MIPFKLLLYCRYTGIHWGIQVLHWMSKVDLLARQTAEPTYEVMIRITIAMITHLVSIAD